MRQIDWRSGRRGKFAHLLHPALEEWPRIVRSGACLGMELQRAGAQLRELESLDRAVVERDVRRLESVARRDREAVVLARDQHATPPALEDGMVRAAMAEFELERRVVGREGEQLVTEADAEDRDFPEQLAD